MSKYQLIFSPKVTGPKHGKMGKKILSKGSIPSPRWLICARLGCLFSEFFELGQPKVKYLPLEPFGKYLFQLIAPKFYHFRSEIWFYEGLPLRQLLKGSLCHDLWGARAIGTQGKPILLENQQIFLLKSEVKIGFAKRVSKLETHLLIVSNVLWIRAN